MRAKNLLKRIFRWASEDDVIIQGIPAEKPQSRKLFCERSCIGCMRAFKKWGVSNIPLIEQFCSNRCKKSFFHGYDLGLRAGGDWSRRKSWKHL